MTLALSLKVNDGVVLAADSASMFIVSDPRDGYPLAQNVYYNASKVFNLYKGLPIGAITWGAGSIGNASIATLMKDLRAQLTDGVIDPKNYTVEDFANRLRKYVYEETYKPAFQDWPDNLKPFLGFTVAGFSSGASRAEDYRLEMVGDVCNGPTPIWGLGGTGVTWNGQREAITRLLLGFGTQMSEVLEKVLGVPQDQIGPAMEAIRQYLGVSLVAPEMPLQDAIDLAEFLVDMTIKYSRFSIGPQMVGGPIEVAAISKYEGFKWIHRKHFYSRDINPL